MSFTHDYLQPFPISHDFTQPFTAGQNTPVDNPATDYEYFPESDRERAGMTNLISLPNEILHNVFRYVDPLDLARLSRSCKLLRENIRSDGQLYKAVYCRILDEPRDAKKARNFDYEKETHDFVRFRRILESERSAEAKVEHLPFIAAHTTSLLRSAHPQNSANIALLSTYLASTPRTPLLSSNAEAFLTQSSTFERSILPTSTNHSLHRAPTTTNLHDVIPLTKEHRQASAKLHVLYGCPLLLPRRSKWHTPYPFAVSKVYDLRNYTEDTLWGPYLGDGKASVDWEKVEAVMLVLGHNLSVFRQTVGEANIPEGFCWRAEKGGWKGATPGSYVPRSFVKESAEGEWEDVGSAEVEEGVEKKEKIEDPYGIEGTWMRVVCFLDFHDLFAYNFTSPSLSPSIPRPALSTTEAIRLITMEVRVTHTTPPDPEDGQDLPVVHFSGVSRSLHSAWDVNANSNIRGSVRLTAEGEVRWQTISVYNGEERWRSEGIQVGGVRSARGVFGHWFDKDHDIHGPAGPTAFYKVSDGIRSHEDEEEEEDDEEYFDGEVVEEDEEEEDDGEEGEFADVDQFIGQILSAVGQHAGGGSVMGGGGHGGNVMGEEQEDGFGMAGQMGAEEPQGDEIGIKLQLGGGVVYLNGAALHGGANVGSGSGHGSGHESGLGLDEVD